MDVDCLLTDHRKPRTLGTATHATRPRKPVQQESGDVTRAPKTPRLEMSGSIGMIQTAPASLILPGPLRTMKVRMLSAKSRYNLETAMYYVVRDIQARIFYSRTGIRILELPLAELLVSLPIYDPLLNIQILERPSPAFRFPMPISKLLMKNVHPVLSRSSRMSNWKVRPSSLA